ncbi:hypothetical protein AEA42_06355 [Shewanella sp. Sh95]|nr:hypothetical protein AEA42_06355 [Shewanella sp. Sh95]
MLLFQLKSCTLITIKVQNETMLILLTLMSAFRSFPTVDLGCQAAKCQLQTFQYEGIKVCF